MTAAAAGDLGNSPEHRRTGRAAPVVVTFGELGRLLQDAVWPTAGTTPSRGCPACWQGTRQVTAQRLPGLINRDTPTHRSDPASRAATGPTARATAAHRRRPAS